jgi:predicted GNAT family N-acyltransferase
MTIEAAADTKSVAQTFEVRIARSAAEFEEIVTVRARVFRDEQEMVSQVLTDADDRSGVHAYARLEGGVIAIGRLTPPANGRAEGQIAWVAVVPEHRGGGAGSAVMKALLAVADRHRFPSVLISAQGHAIPFYRRLGFIPFGDPFMVKGIEHQYMERRRPRG